jgi:CCR4-NOT transcriptional regulation complex NOT5 subunit
MKMFGMVQEQKEIIIVTPDWEYTIDLVENTGTKQANPKKFLIQEFNNLSKTKQKKVIKNSESLGISTLEGMDGTFEKNAEKIMGHQCDKVSMVGGTTTYLFSGTDLPLRIKGNNMGVKFNQDATIIKKESAPTSKFKLPSNIQFEHNKQIDQMMQDRAQTIIQSLVDSTHLKSTGTGMQTSKVPDAPSSAVTASTEQAPAEQDTNDLQDQMKKLMNIFGKPKE